MTALAAGVPQVILPLFSLDQHLNAERIDAIEAGVAVTFDLENMAGLADAVERLLNVPSYKDAAAAVRHQIEELPPANHMVPKLESLVPSH